MRSILVTGDVVLDCHLYGGVKTAATSFSEPGTVYTTHLGGASLSEKILRAAADSESLTWDARHEEWERKNQSRQSADAKRPSENIERKAKGKEELPPILPLPWPEDLTLAPPKPAYTVDSGLDDSGLKASLPPHLHSFGVWTPHLVKQGVKDPTDTVWRVQKHFGYGSARDAGSNPVFAIAKKLPTEPALLYLDDGGILFRHERARPVWPRFSAHPANPQEPFVVLKMSAPLCRGELWAHLTARDDVANRLLVVLSASDLRREDSQIRQYLSWEQCAADTLLALHNGPLAKQLLQAAHVVVSFSDAGALWLHREQASGDHKAELIYDPLRLEGDFNRTIDGTVYGFQTCLSAAITHHLMVAHLESAKMATAISTGIVSGLQARRRLLELGHGKVGTSGVPGFPVTEIGRVIAGKHGDFAQVTMPPVADFRGACQWNILADSQQPGHSCQHHIGLAQLTAIHGRSALSQVPSLAMGKLFTVDRLEIESLRTLERLMREYEREKVQKKPLSLGVFGPPGAGKSFGVKAIAQAIMGDKVPILEFNLSQFKDTTDLIGAFHRVRDEVLKGITPVAFWDEFDSHEYKWLQYLLAPMQDGSFQEGQVTHPIGKCIFVFAGGTADSLDGFGIKEPCEMAADARGALQDAAREDRIKVEDAYQRFRLLKGPDFISRLHGHLDVLGPNPRKSLPVSCPDRTWPIRRALILRSVLGMDKDLINPSVLDMDAGLLFALLDVPEYKHGARSLEKILLTLAQDRQDGHYHRSALPPDLLLNRETGAAEFHRRMDQRNAFKTNPDIEQLAAAIHENYLANAKSNKWDIKPEVDRPYADLAPDFQASNRGAARRIPDLLSLIDFKVIANPSPADKSWQKPLADQIGMHRERLAQAEHLGWNAERFANGWKYAPVRNDSLKQHTLLVDWARLSESDKNKDRENMNAIPIWLNLAKHKAVPVSAKD